MASAYASAHANPKGPGDARPTASQILQDEGLVTLPNRLTGKNILITGGTSGLGLEVAAALHQTGAKVYISGRCDVAKGQETAVSISTGTDNGLSPVHFVQMDLADLQSVSNGATAFLAQSDGTLNILICNAGVMAPQTRLPTKQGHEMQFGVNHLAHLLLFQKLRGALLTGTTKEVASRVIVVSSCAHRTRSFGTEPDYDFVKSAYDPMVSYGWSKTENIYMANEIERQFGARGLHGLSVHPGVIMDTGLTRHLTDDHKKLEAMFAENPKFMPVTKSSAQGAGCILWASVAESLNGRGGLYLEDCGEGLPAKKYVEWWDPGTSEWCYDQEAEQRLDFESKRILQAWL